MNMIIRILTATLGVLALVGVGFFWFNPAETVLNFGLTFDGPLGQATVRSDLAGLFLALGIFPILAAVQQNGSYAKVALVMTAAVFVGRIINLIVGGMAPGLLFPIGLELVMMAVFYAGSRMWDTTKS